MLRSIKVFVLILFLSLNAFVFSEGNIVYINTPEEFENIISKGGVVVADFFATWCPPCKMLSPILEELSETYKGKVDFVKIDVDKVNILASKYRIESIPDVRIFKGGQEQKQLIGLMEKSDYVKTIDEYLAESK